MNKKFYIALTNIKHTLSTIILVKSFPVLRSELSLVRTQNLERCTHNPIRRRP